MGNIQKGPGGRWRARYRDNAGREHARPKSTIVVDEGVTTSVDLALPVPRTTARTTKQAEK